jgi:succinate-semialdehyde dehydrogenase / glutarate-semialdehyde dehydrogenase
MTPGDTGPPIATVNPVTGEVLQCFEPFDAVGVERALENATIAARRWASSSFAERAILLNTVAELLEAELPDIAHGVTTEMGKPFAQAKGEVAKCASAFRWFAENGEALLADEEVPLGAAVGRVTLRPLGAVLVVASWSFPLWQATRFVGSALMAGNVGLLKSAPNVPRTTLVYEDLFRRAGAPEGLLQALLIGTDQLPAIVADRRVAAVAAAGTVAEGRALAAQAGAAVKKVVLELGGSDPFVVLPSADVARAVAVGVEARINNAGQSSTAATRFIVDREVAEEFTRGFVAAMERLSVGDPFDPATEVGPLATEAARETLAAQVDDARARGATVLCGGRSLCGPGGSDHPGYFYCPTVITDVTSDMRVANEEVFGPVALLSTVANADEALAQANGSDFGMGASVWTADPDEQQRFAEELESGQVWFNGPAVVRPELPFGGIKSSGFGRELSSFGLREFCNVKSVWSAS